MCKFTLAKQPRFLQHCRNTSFDIAVQAKSLPYAQRPCVGTQKEVVETTVVARDVNKTYPPPWPPKHVRPSSGAKRTKAPDLRSVQHPHAASVPALELAPMAATAGEWSVGEAGGDRGKTRKHASWSMLNLREGLPKM